MRSFAPVISAISAVILGSTANASLVSVTWVGPTSGSWETAANWNPAGVPNNSGSSTYAVQISTPSFVSLGSSPTITSLAIAAGATLDVKPTFDPNVGAGPLQNDGLIFLHGGTGETQLRFGGSVTLLGTGTIQMGGALCRMTPTVYGRITNTAAHTIRGTGYMGDANTLVLTNAGLIEAVNGALTVYISGTVNENFNSGIIRGRDGSTVIMDGAFDNTGGRLEAVNGGAVRIDGPSLLTGDLVTDADSEILLASVFCILKNSTITGNVRVLANGASPRFTESVVNNGMFTIDARWGNSSLYILSNASLTGAGVIEGIYGTGAAFISASSTETNSLLLHGPLHTIRGAVQIDGNMAMVNQGMIEATDPAHPMKLLPSPNVAWVNQGLIRATSGDVVLNGGSITNTGGSIVALTGRTLQIGTTKLSGGEVRAEGTAQVRFESNGSSSRLTSLSIAGHAVVTTHSTLELAGTIVHDGDLTIDGASATANVLSAVGPIVLNGAGTVLLTGSNASIKGSSTPASSLTNGAQHSIRGAGGLGSAQLVSIVNSGSIIADGPTSLTVMVGTGFSNAGLLRASVGQTIISPTGAWSNTGSIAIEPGATLSRGGTFIQTAGQTQVDGTLAMGSGTYLQSGGELRGTGIIAGSATASGGTVYGTGLQITGAYQQQVGATFVARVGPTLADPTLVTIGGTATLAGALHLTKHPGYLPVAGDSFMILQAAARTGTFGEVVSCDPVAVTYTDTSVIVTYTAGSGVLGDLNRDGLLNQADVALLLESWGRCLGECCDADLNGDGQVNGKDLGLLLSLSSMQIIAPKTDADVAPAVAD